MPDTWRPREQVSWRVWAAILVIMLTTAGIIIVVNATRPHRTPEQQGLSLTSCTLPVTTMPWVRLVSNGRLTGAPIHVRQIRYCAGAPPLGTYVMVNGRLFWADGPVTILTLLSGKQEILPVNDQVYAFQTQQLAEKS